MTSRATHRRMTLRMDRIAQLVESVPVRYWRILRYLIAGGLATLTNLVILYLLTSGVGLWYIYSSIISLSTATVVSFVLQKLWTFKNFDSSRVHVQLPLHIALALSNIVINAMLLYVFVEWIHIWYLIAQIFAGAMLACMNYFVYKHVIFVSA